MMGLFLCMLSFFIVFIYRSVRESDRKKMVEAPDGGPQA